MEICARLQPLDYRFLIGLMLTRPAQQTSPRMADVPHLYAQYYDEAWHRIALPYSSFVLGIMASFPTLKNNCAASIAGLGQFENLHHGGELNDMRGIR